MKFQSLFVLICFFNHQEVLSFKKIKNSIIQKSNFNDIRHSSNVLKSSSLLMSPNPDKENKIIRANAIEDKVDKNNFTSFLKSNLGFKKLFSKNFISTLSSIALALIILFPLPGFASQRGKSTQKELVAQQRQLDHSDDQNKSPTIIASKYASVDFMLEDQEASEKEGKFLNKIGVFLIGASVIFSFIKKDDSSYSTRKKSKSKLSSGSSFKRSPKTLKFQEGQLKGIMSKLDQTLSERMNNEGTSSEKISDDQTIEIEPLANLPAEEFIDKTEKETLSKFDASVPNFSSKTKRFSSKFSGKLANNESDEIKTVSNTESDDDEAFINSLGNDEKTDSLVENVNENKSVSKDATKDTIPDNQNRKERGFLDRIFRKNKSSMAVDLSELLLREGKTQIFHAAVAKALVQLTPDDIFPDLRDEKVLEMKTGLGLVSKAKLAASLSDQEATDAFAEVVNCLIIAIVDRAVETLGEQDESISVSSLDSVIEFMTNAIQYFDSVSNGCKPCEAVVYNGDAKKGKLEDLYYRYAKSAMSISNMVSNLKLGLNNETATEEDPSDTLKSAEDKMNNLQFLTQIFAIKQGKKEQLDLKVMREMMMSMTKGEGLEDLSGILGALGGKSGMEDMGGLKELLEQTGGGAGFDPDKLKEMLGGGDFDPDKLREMQEMLKESGVPDMDDMDPSKFADFSKKALGDLTSALSDGSISKQEIIEFEKMMGVSLETQVQTLKQGVNNRAIKDMFGADSKKILDVFQRLLDIKKKG